mmetsp:Transcript_29868/g.41030  ORF Transcript_29868/g.41030 Transcript_29868/m.41030 type:complete len:103 (+) Transcript_29868:136-444(+)
MYRMVREMWLFHRDVNASLLASPSRMAGGKHRDDPTAVTQHMITPLRDSLFSPKKRLSIKDVERRLPFQLFNEKSIYCMPSRIKIVFSLNKLVLSNSMNAVS